MGVGERDKGLGLWAAMKKEPFQAMVVPAGGNLNGATTADSGDFGESFWLTSATVVNQPGVL